MRTAADRAGHDSSPFSVPWSDVTAGSYTLTAVVTDSRRSDHHVGAGHVTVSGQRRESTRRARHGGASSSYNPATYNVAPSSTATVAASTMAATASGTTDGLGLSRLGPDYFRRQPDHRPDKRVHGAGCVEHAQRAHAGHDLVAVGREGLHGLLLDRLDVQTVPDGVVSDNNLSGARSRSRPRPRATSLCASSGRPTAGAA